GDESIPERSGGLLHAQEKLRTTPVVRCMRPKRNPGCSVAEPGEYVIICIPLIPAAWFDKLTILRRTISSSLSLRAEGLSMVEGRVGVFAGR
ncbi:MAG: hypothetical protein Q8P49_01545, partial [Candidatus Liptonbacteria bacterium]|nr:hypothetical protein [Candidatus Liptonbacteria bacterium]